MSAQLVIDDYYISSVQTGEEVIKNASLCNSTLYLCTDANVDRGLVFFVCQFV